MLNEQEDAITKKTRTTLVPSRTTPLTTRSNQNKPKKIEFMSFDISWKQL
jgi:hypothetical protein